GLPERVHGGLVTARLGKDAFHLVRQHQVGQTGAAHQPGAGVGGLVHVHVRFHATTGTAPQGLGDDVGRHGAPVLRRWQDRRIVLGQLDQTLPGLLFQAVGTRVTDVEPVVPIVLEQESRDRGPHSRELGVLLGVVLDLLVDVAEQLGDLRRTVQVGAGLRKTVDSVFGSYLARGLTTDTVGDRKDDGLTDRQDAAYR